MGETSIEWTATVNPDGSVTPGKTWNPLRGCSRVSEGCRHCYAETIAARFSQPGNTFHGFAERTPEGPRWTGDVVLLKDRLAEPFSWRKPARVFVNSMSDMFHEGLSDEDIDQVFAIMALTPQHTYQVLTKRAERMRSYLAYEYRWAQIEGACNEIVGPSNAPALATPERRSLPNVWLGVSVENQHFADERIPLLLDTPAAVRFISAEPLLDAVDLFAFLDTPTRNKCLGILGGHKGVPGLDWVIVGGESGQGARSFDVAWARSIVAQCKAAGVACFVKQLGKWPLSHQDENLHGGEYWVPLYSKSCGRGPTGEFGCEGRGKKGDPSEWPADLRVRQMPEAR